MRFYNRGVLVKREVIGKRPTLTGIVNTDLTLTTGRNSYVEDDQYHKFKKTLDSLVDDIPDTPHYSNVLVQKSLNKLARVLEKALSTVDIALPAEYKIVNEQQTCLQSVPNRTTHQRKREGKTNQDYHCDPETSQRGSCCKNHFWHCEGSTVESVRSSCHDHSRFHHPESFSSARVTTSGYSGKL